MIGWKARRIKYILASHSAFFILNVNKPTCTSNVLLYIILYSDILVQYLLLVVERIKILEGKSPYPVLHRLSSVVEGS